MIVYLKILFKNFQFYIEENHDNPSRIAGDTPGTRYRNTHFISDVGLSYPKVHHR